MINDAADAADAAAVKPALLARVAAGDEAAMRECIKVYGPLIWSLARRSCQQHGDAEDAVQEIFIELWKVSAKFDDALGSEATFVSMLARRRLIDRFRRRLPVEIDIDDTELSDDAAAMTALDHDIDFATVRRGLQRLRPEERRVLDLSFTFGLSQSEIVTQTGLPLGTVKSHARRGLASLREWMGVSARASAPAADEDES